MSKKFKCVSAWARHSAGEVIPEGEYNRLPYEIKQRGNFEEVPIEISQAFSESFLTVTEPPVIEQVTETIDESPFEPLDVPIEATVDLFADEKPRNRYAKKGL